MKFADLSLATVGDLPPSKDRDAYITHAFVSPVEAYYTLRDNFGQPNSSEFDNTKTQWAYLLKTKDVIINVYDWKLESWTIEVFEANENKKRAEKIGLELASLIEKNRMKHKGIINKIAKIQNTIY